MVGLSVHAVIDISLISILSLLLPQLLCVFVKKLTATMLKGFQKETLADSA